MKCQSKYRLWLRMAIIPVFLVLTGVFSFLWNMPLCDLYMPQAADAEVQVYKNGKAVEMNDAYRDYLGTIYERYLPYVRNAGHITRGVPAETDFVLSSPECTVYMNQDEFVFDFDTKYGVRLTTCKKPDQYDLSLYRFLEANL